MLVKRLGLEESPEQVVRDLLAHTLPGVPGSDPQHYLQCKGPAHTTYQWCGEDGSLCPAQHAQNNPGSLNAQDSFDTAAFIRSKPHTLFNKVYNAY